MHMNKRIRVPLCRVVVIILLTLSVSRAKTMKGPG